MWSLWLYYKQYVSLRTKKRLYVFLVCLIFCSLLRWIKYYLLLTIGGVSFTVQSELAVYLDTTPPKIYLVALMNTSERKPDGGFFWSYAIVRLGSGKLLQMYDSYYPQTIAPVRVQLPERFYPVMKTRDVGFLGGNMVWFTAIDGKSIVDIYEQTFHERLDGVIFLKYDAFRYLLPDFDHLSWTREFQNACIDLIRGNYIGNKKELYFAGIKSYISWSYLFRLVRRFFINRPTIRDAGYVRIYLPHASSNLQDWLVNSKLSVRPEAGQVFFYDYNLGFNKIDKFVHKTVFSWDVLHITYSLNIPQSYFDHIEMLRQKYNIVLTDREKTILSIDPQVWTRGVIYVPKSVQVVDVWGDGVDVQQFPTPFGSAILYDIVGKWDGLVREVFVRVKKRE